MIRMTSKQFRVTWLMEAGWELFVRSGSEAHIYDWDGLESNVIEIHARTVTALISKGLIQTDSFINDETMGQKYRLSYAARRQLDQWVTE